MTLNQAIEDLINSESFREKAKLKDSTGSKYRMFLTRYNRGELKNGAALDMLLEHGYIIDIKKTAK